MASLRFAMSLAPRWSKTILVISAESVEKGSCTVHGGVRLLSSSLLPPNVGFLLASYTGGLSRCERPGMSIGFAARYSQPG